MNKYTLSLIAQLIVLVVVLCLPGCSNSNPDTESQEENVFDSEEFDPHVFSEEVMAEMEELRKKAEEEEARNRTEGKYSFTDAMEEKYTLTLTPDHRAILECHDRAIAVTNYGIWEKRNSEYVKIEFSYNDTPRMNFKIPWNINYREPIIYMYLCEGYLYESIIDCEAKNPKVRLEVKKIEN